MAEGASLPAVAIQPSDERLPITVVIPIRNEVATMPGLIEAIAGQSAPPQHVIVVDAGSTDGTRAYLRQRAASDPTLQVIEVPRAYPGEGRNLGTAAAQTEWIAYIDGGVIPEPDWLEGLWHAATAEVEAVFGYYRAALPNRTATWFAWAALPGARPVDGGLMRNQWIANSLIRKAAWERIGGFPPFRAAEDRLFMMQLDAERQAIAPASTVTWVGPTTWLQIWRRTATLAEHSARAGRTRDWHWPTVRLVGAAVALWLMTPGWLSGSIIPAAWLARGFRRIGRHRHDPTLVAYGPVDVLAVAACLTLMDLALFWGWARRWLRPRDRNAL